MVEAAVEAVKTTASTFAIWAIVVVAVACLAFWLIAIYVADGQQVRASRRRLDASAPADASVPVDAEAPTLPDLPAQPGPSVRHAMPAQRTGDADRAERTSS